jgi:hypothetical protein
VATLSKLISRLLELEKQSPDKRKVKVLTELGEEFKIVKVLEDKETNFIWLKVK